ncbi:hypothetical protein [Niameybacter massiliensis]|uniref:hypothetical protein n=1 Tax=Niameybacter massiliensis TaxID=1658108 RepID=UPI0006B47248|nr:hypothetical protein [Niameybacter massiliensis]
MKWFQKLFNSSKIKKEPFHVKYEKSGAAGLMEELDQTATKKERLQQHMNRLLEKAEELKVYEQLDEQDRNQLVLYVGQYRSIEEQKQHLKGRLIKNNQGLRRLEAYEEELPYLVKEVNETERKVKENERDIFYLEEEKEELKEEREALLQGYSFLKGASFFFMLLMIFMLFAGFAMLQMLRDKIWVYLSGVSIILVFVLFAILFAKEKLETGLRNNAKLQQKAVKYLNKAKIRYFNNYSYLQYQFDKLGVDSAAKLEMYYNRYLKNKNNEVEYNKFNRALMQIELSIKEIFEGKALNYEDEFDHLEEWIMAPKKAEAYEQVEEEKKKVLLQIEALEAYEAELWKELFVLKEDPQYAKNIEEYISLLDKEKQDA